MLEGRSWGSRRPVPGRSTASRAAALLVLFVAAAASGEQLPDDWELQATGGVFYAQGAKSGNINVDLSLGRFLPSPAWEIGLAQALGYQFIDGRSDVWTASTTPFLNYHFRGLFSNPGVVPFVGVLGGMIWNNRDVTGTIGPAAGLKVFLSDQAFFVTRYRYEYFVGDLRLGGSEKSPNGNHVVNIGLGFVFGGAERESLEMREGAFVEQAERITERAERAASEAEEAARRAEEAAKDANRAADEAAPPGGTK